MSWIYNSLDDSILPTQGRFVEGGVSLRVLSSDLVAVSSLETAEQHSADLRFVGSFLRYWPLSDRTSLSFAADGFLGGGEVENLPLESGRLVDDELSVYGASLSFGHARFLKQVYNGTPKNEKRRPRWRELRWENELDVFFEGTSPHFNEPFNPVRGYRIGTGLLFRTTWGVFRLRIKYEEVEGR